MLKPASEILREFELYASVRTKLIEQWLYPVRTLLRFAATGENLLALTSNELARKDISTSKLYRLKKFLIFIEEHDLAALEVLQDIDPVRRGNLGLVQAFFDAVGKHEGSAAGKGLNIILEEIQKTGLELPVTFFTDHNPASISAARNQIKVALEFALWCQTNFHSDNYNALIVLHFSEPEINRFVSHLQSLVEPIQEKNELTSEQVARLFECPIADKLVLRLCLYEGLLINDIQTFIQKNYKDGTLTLNGQRISLSEETKILMDLYLKQTGGRDRDLIFQIKRSDFEKIGIRAAARIGKPEMRFTKLRTYFSRHQDKTG